MSATETRTFPCILTEGDTLKLVARPRGNEVWVEAHEPASGDVAMVVLDPVTAVETGLALLELATLAERDAL